MSTYRLTPHNFDTGGLRSTLRWKHGFERADLERAKSVVLSAISHIEEKTDTKSGMGAHHLDMAMKYLKDTPEGKKVWNTIPEHQRPHVESALIGHFDVSEAKKAA